MNIRIRVDNMHGEIYDFIRPIGQADIDGTCFIGNWMIQTHPEMITDEPANNVNQDAGGFDDMVEEMQNGVQ